MTTPRHGMPVSPGECRILSTLEKHADGLGPAKIADAAGIARPTVSVLIKRLLAEGRVRYAWIRGTRGTVYRITAEGRKARKEFAEAVGLVAA